MSQHHPGAPAPRGPVPTHGAPTHGPTWTHGVPPYAVPPYAVATYPGPPRPPAPHPSPATRARAIVTLVAVILVSGPGAFLTTIGVYLSRYNDQCRWQAARTFCSPLVPVLYLLPWIAAIATTALAVVAIACSRNPRRGERWTAAAWILGGLSALLWCALYVLPTRYLLG